MDLSRLNEHPHRRRNSLTGEWVLVSPQRSRRPWQGELSPPLTVPGLTYDPNCYLCPGNIRANGEKNPDYSACFAFTNDFSSLLPQTENGRFNPHPLLLARSENGICRVVNFSPRHDLTLAELDPAQIEVVVDVWQQETAALSQNPDIHSVLIFENKGALMGNSNPHPHCQIWAQSSLPDLPKKELRQFRAHYNKTGCGLLESYLDVERGRAERIVYENDGFVVLVPFWAVWPFETLLLPRRAMASLLEMTPAEKRDFALALSVLTAKYDNLFRIPFPYSSGIHQAPFNDGAYPEWHWHMHFYPPLLRSASIRKFMVGYEMLAEAQRDISPEFAAEKLRSLSSVHHKKLSHPPLI